MLVPPKVQSVIEPSVSQYVQLVVSVLQMIFLMQMKFAH